MCGKSNLMGEEQSSVSAESGYLSFVLPCEGCPYFQVLPWLVTVRVHFDPLDD